MNFSSLQTNRLTSIFRSRFFLLVQFLTQAFGDDLYRNQVDRFSLRERIEIFFGHRKRFHQHFVRRFDFFHLDDREVRRRIAPADDSHLSSRRKKNFVFLRIRRMIPQRSSTFRLDGNQRSVLTFAGERARFHRVDRGGSGSERPPGHLAVLGQLFVEILRNVAPENFFFRSSNEKMRTNNR